MAALGENNAQVVMHLFFQQLHALMQEQVHIPSHERPRVPTIWDEGGYVASMNTIKQAATHREAGLEVAMGIQYISQLGAKAESATVTEAIRKGATNLLQSRCLFRLGDPEDAETQTRVAQSVFQSRITPDIDARELMGVTPEESLYLPNWYCLASLIASGARAARFFGETYAFAKLRDGPWAEHHRRVLEQAVGPYPEQMPKTYKRLGSSIGGDEEPPVAASDATQPVAPAPKARTARATGDAPAAARPRRQESRPSAGGRPASPRPRGRPRKRLRRAPLRSPSRRRSRHG